MKKCMGLMMLSLMVLGIHSGNARPYPDRLGICYVFVGDEVSQKAPCIIASGYGAGSSYVGLEFNHKNYVFETSTMSEDGKTTYEDKPVRQYVRHAGFYHVIGDDELESVEPDDMLYCYRTRDKKLDICHN